MKNARLNSKQNSDETSASARRPPPRGRSERRYLADQAADAKIAMAQTLHEMNDTVKRVMDVRPYAKRHPWLVVGSALAAGFIAGAVLKPAPQKTAEIAGSSATTESPPRRRRQNTLRTRKPPVISTAVTFLAGILQTFVVNSLIAAAVAAQDRSDVEAPTPHDSPGEADRED